MNPDFHVDPAALRELAAAMDGNGATSAQASSYAAEPPLGNTGVLPDVFNAVARHHDEAVAAVRQSLDQLTSALAGSSRELLRSADAYVAWDQHGAAAIDRTYPG